jgi:predicted nucleotidyltransferase
MNIKRIGLSDALFPKVRQVVLGILFCQPDTQFYTNEIIRMSGTGNGAVQRELEKLTQAGVISLQVIGNKKLYQANRESPIFSELQGIAQKTFGIAEQIRESLSTVSNKILFAFIYGSVAKHEDTSSSDIDIIIISDSLSYADVYPLVEDLQLKVGREINPTFYSSESWIKKIQSKNNFVMNILKQQKIFLIGSVDEFNKFG